MLQCVGEAGEEAEQQGAGAGPPGCHGQDPAHSGGATGAWGYRGNILTESKASAYIF